MKRSAAVAVVMTIVLSFVSSLACAGIGARVYGGLTHISYSDYNEWVDDANEELGVGENLDNMKWVPEFGGELYYSVAPMFEIGLGAGMILGSTEYSFSELTSFIDFNHKMKAFPISANLYFRPSVPFVSMKPYLYGGGGMYYSRLDFGFKISDGTDTWGYDAELSTWGFGIHGGGGMEFSIAPTFSLDIGFRVRWADISGYEGSATNTDGETIDVFLVGDTDGDGDAIYDIAPLEDKADYDEGSVDLTGFTIYIGFKAGF
ncbi:MAG: outer membrane beta-barrel protein [Candidatus Krumholzibacteria bacterium]|nr:outer membrane beta-barrel protein [Candidatus Krumholzibacteria bacterium]